MHNEIELTFTHEASGAEMYLVICTTEFGVAAGGLRIGQDVTFAMVSRLAETMTKKFAVFNLPVAGAKCGIRIPPGTTAESRNEIISSFASKIKTYLRSILLIGHDLGSGMADIRRIYDTIAIHRLVAIKRILANTAMKSLIQYTPDFIIRSFLPAYSDSGLDLTGRAMINSLAVLTSPLKKMEELSYAVQGAGGVGQSLLAAIDQSGGTVKAIADIHGGVSSAAGLPVARLLAAINDKGELDRDRLGRSIHFAEFPGDEWSGQDVDVLIPAAVSDAFARCDRGRVTADYIIEAANLAMDDGMDRYFHGKGITVLPDFLVNSAICCSFGLMVANKISPYNNRKIAKATLRYMAETLKEVHQAAKDGGVSLREAAYSRCLQFDRR